MTAKQLLTIVAAAILCSMFPLLVHGQDDLMNMLGRDSTVSPYTSAAFKSTRILNIQTSETAMPHTLDLRISHRFGAIGTSTNGTSSSHNLWGFDDVADVRIGFEYGINERLSAGFSRSKYNENYELTGKYRLLRQRKDDKMPVSVTVYGGVCLSGRKDNTLAYDNPSSTIEFERRLEYTGQVILARKFTPRLSAEIIPSVVHRNFTAASQINTISALAVGMRYKFTPMAAFVFDYVAVEKHNTSTTGTHGPHGHVGTSNTVVYRNPLAFGVELETGGHVFSLMLTNALGIDDPGYIANTADRWSKGGFRFSFSITRSFHL